MSLLQMSISAAVLIIVITALRAMFIHKLPKKTFLILWGIVLLRLLIPVSIPSSLSIYSLIPKANINMENTADEAMTGNILLNEGFDPTSETNIVNIKTTDGHTFPFKISLLNAMWLIGFLVCFLYFLFAYLRGINKFKASAVIKNDFIENFKMQHPLKRNLSILKSDKIFAPLTYGIFKPVILLPENLDLNNTKSLGYILTHEYIHVRHFDILKKTVLILSVCIHWFNPMVWIMFILFNRDIELACDESVINMLGENNRAAYAYTLIDMEAYKNNVIPFCNNFSKNAIEERIVAIMKNKKSSVFISIAAFMLVVGVFVFFVTSALQPKQTLKTSDTDFSDEELDKLLALQPDNYEDMSILEYQNKVGKITDTNEYQDLLENILNDDNLYSKKDSDETASFLFNTLAPLTSEKWQDTTFNSYAQTDYPNQPDNALLEYSFTINIKDPSKLKVKEYDSTRLAVMSCFNKLLQDKSEEQLQNTDYMNNVINNEIKNLKKLYNSEKLELTLEYSYRPLVTAKESNIKEINYREPKEESYFETTKKGYDALLALKTPDYQNMSVKDFNMKLLDWANDNSTLAEQIGANPSQTYYETSLSEEERHFIEFTVWLSGMENAKFVKSQYTLKPEEDPVIAIELNDKEKYSKNNLSAWCNGGYRFSYHIKNKNTLSIRNRDYCLNNIISQIQQFWEETDIDSLIKMTKHDIENKFNEIAKNNSNEEIEFNIIKEEIYFEHGIE